MVQSRSFGSFVVLECDKATALQAFWLAEPIWFERYAGDVSKVPGHALETFYFVTEIFERWVQGFYKRTEIAYNRGPGWPTKVVDRWGALRSVPPSMCAELQGRSVVLEDYAEGIPSFLWDPGEIV